MIKVLVIYGGMSSEHEVSCLSASNIIENIDKSKYNVTKLGIDKSGNWFIYSGDVEHIKNNKWRDDILNNEKIIDLLSELKKYDVIFPVLHGKFGEDGTIQGLFELVKIPYVGCDTEGSSIAMDKILSKELAKLYGIDVVDYFSINNTDKINVEELKDIMNKNAMKFPLIVKPNKEGSSYGIKKATNMEELIEAINYALKFDDKVLIEKYIEERQEIECAVLGENKLIASTPGEIFAANEFYDYNSKYENDKSYTKIPANLNEETLNNIKNKSITIFKALRLRGISRIDYLCSKSDGKIYFNEANTMPGFTNISMYPKMLEYDGIEYSKVIDKLISYALSR